MFTEDVLYLSRRNLLALIAKLDANIEKPGTSACAIIKTQDPRLDAPFRQTIDEITVVAVEDEVYYSAQNRAAGMMHPREEQNLPKPSTGIL